LESRVSERAWSRPHLVESVYSPGLSVYLLEDATLLRTANSSDSAFNVGGAGGRVEVIDWDGSLVWTFDYSTDAHRLHHDVDALPTTTF
jgi:hypothetical protein